MKNSYIISITLLIALLVSSCQKEDWTYKGPQYFEFSATIQEQNLMGSIFEKENSVIGLDSIGVQIIKPADGDIEVDYEIVNQIYYLKDKGKYVSAIPSGTAADKVETLTSTAVYGTDYIIETPSGTSFNQSTKKGSVAIQKGKYVGYITVNMKVKSDKHFYVVLRDSKDAQANVPTSILNYIIPPDKVYFLQETFALEMPDTWTSIDKDGDGYNWSWYKQSMTSDSYLDDVGAVNPENYLISPKFNISAKSKNVVLTFDVAAGAKSDYKEKYKVLVSEVPVTSDNCRNLTVIRDWTTLTDANKSKTFVTERIDMKDFIGKSVYIVFLHGNCTDMYYILLKNVYVYSY